MLTASRYIEIHRETQERLLRQRFKRDYRDIYIYSKRESYLFIRDHIQRDLFMADGDPVRWSNALHSARGSGSGSRSRLDFAKLEEAGWQILSRQSGTKTRTDFVDPEGRKFKSAKDVERKLESDGTLDEFLKGDEAYENKAVDKAVPLQQNSAQAVKDPKDSDEEYEPPTKQKAHEDVCKSG